MEQDNLKWKAINQACIVLKKLYLIEENKFEEVWVRHISECIMILGLDSGKHSDGHVARELTFSILSGFDESPNFFLGIVGAVEGVNFVSNFHQFQLF